MSGQEDASRIYLGGFMTYLDQIRNQALIRQAQYYLNHVRDAKHSQEIGLGLLNKAEPKTGAIPANFFFSL
jgi:hypothetical protein